MESLTPVLVEEMELLSELLPASSTVLVLDPERVRTRAHDSWPPARSSSAPAGARRVGGKAPIDLGAASLRSLGDVRARVLERGQAWWGVSPFGIGPRTRRTRTTRCAPCVPCLRSPTAATSRPRSPTSDQVAGGHTSSPSTRATGRPADVELLAEHDVPARMATEVAETLASCSSPRAPSTTACCSTTRVMVVTGEDLVGQKASTRDMRKMPSRRRKQIDPLELKPATTWSTSSTGSGFVEMRQREVHGAVREYLSWSTAPASGAPRPIGSTSG